MCLALYVWFYPFLFSPFFFPFFPFPFCFVVWASYTQKNILSLSHTPMITWQKYVWLLQCERFPTVSDSSCLCFFCTFDSSRTFLADIVLNMWSHFRWIRVSKSQSPHSRYMESLLLPAVLKPRVKSSRTGQSRKRLGRNMPQVESCSWNRAGSSQERLLATLCFHCFFVCCFWDKILCLGWLGTP